MKSFYVVQNEPVGKVLISGRALAHRKLDARQKAAIAGAILAGDAALKLTASQLAKLLGVNAAYVALAAELSPGKRQAIASGADDTSFAMLKQHHAHSEKLAKVG
jgi:hypothetical protein